MEAIVIIPARMSATRFPGKPLAKIANYSMIAHCYLRASMAKLAKKVYVATCDTEIASEIEKLNGQTIMTSDKHERASERTAEALSYLKSIGTKVDVVVMLQGDEPLIDPNCIDQLIEQHQHYPDVPVFNLTQYIHSQDDFYNVNVVKAITNLKGDILAFSREPIPSARLKGLGNYTPKKQLGVISFRDYALEDFDRLDQTPLEKIESIDMMRLLENGRNIKEVITDSTMMGVDTPEDAKRVELLIKEDLIYQTYKLKNKIIA